MPLSLAVNVFHEADVNHFLQYGSVRCHMGELPKVWSLRAGGTTPWESEDWSDMGIDESTAFLEVKAVELALNYTEHMTRFQLRRPNLTGVPREKRSEHAKDMLKMWTKVMQSSKRAQMQTEQHSGWPPDDFRPWKIVKEEDMPMVLWIAEQSAKL